MPSPARLRPEVLYTACDPATLNLARMQALLGLDMQHAGTTSLCRVKPAAASLDKLAQLRREFAKSRPDATGAES